jgi:hypothetical protein
MVTRAFWRLGDSGRAPHATTGFSRRQHARAIAFHHSRKALVEISRRQRARAIAFHHSRKALVER